VHALLWLVGEQSTRLPKLGRTTEIIGPQVLGHARNSPVQLLRQLCLRSANRLGQLVSIVAAVVLKTDELPERVLVVVVASIG